MRKVVNGTVYNTVGAKRIAVSVYRYPGEKTLVYECIYKKRNNSLFLFRSGNPGSKYGEYLNVGTSVIGDDIIPISHDEAHKWLQCHHPDYYYSPYADINQLLAGLKR